MKTIGLSQPDFLVIIREMRLSRFNTKNGATHIGLVADDSALLDLTSAGLSQMAAVLEADNPVDEVQKFVKRNPPRVAFSEITFAAPVERQEVWAAGVTYLRSKTARMEESDFSANAYDKVYSADRPEIFFKSLAEKVAGPGEAVGIRQDATWNVPEPELALVINNKGRIAGYTVGNDMSSRDIEGANLLYLPQAKIYTRSCALGPWITLGIAESAAREWTIRIGIKRDGSAVFTGETSVGQIKRSFTELVSYLFRSQEFPHGAVLLTGTGVVPPESFTLHAKDVIEIEISGIGVLRNSVTVV